MASNLIIIDTSLRRHVVKCNPNQPLSEAVDGLCKKLNLDSRNYGLKYNDKLLDLSYAYRLSGLSNSARVSLIQIARTPSVVSVGLQYPNSGGPQRLMGKFRDDTSVWKILRAFENGDAGESKVSLNFTMQAAPQIANASGSGAGRLCYRMPVIQVNMSRELASFQELQHTLSDLHIRGNCSLRLDYRNTGQPLEEAMAEISAYFDSQAVTQPVSEVSRQPEASSAAVSDPPGPVESSNSPSPTGRPEMDAAQQPPEDAPEASEKSDSKRLSIFAPPSSSTPAAASQAVFDESDYVPTLDHAKYHQARLNTESRNKRLLSDAELESQRQNRASALARVNSVEVRVRFPDQSQVQRVFGKDETVNDLYSLCREVMNRPHDESFGIRLPGTNHAPLKEGSARLIEDLRWQGRVLVTVTWNDDVALSHRQSPSLKEEYRSVATSIKAATENTGPSAAQASAPSPDIPKQKDPGDKDARLKKFLKGLSKK